MSELKIGDWVFAYSPGYDETIKKGVHIRTTTQVVRIMPTRICVRSEKGQPDSVFPRWAVRKIKNPKKKYKDEFWVEEANEWELLVDTTHSHT